MKLGLWVLVGGFSVAAIHAQPCPAVSFLEGSAVPVVDSTSVAALQRQPDGSFTKQRYQTKSPYSRIDSTANFQSAFVNCSGAGARTFQTPPGWVALADRPGAVSQTLVASDFLGNGTPVGLAVVPGGFAPGVSVDSLLVAISNPEGSLKSQTYYPVPTNVSSLLVADLNHDGKKDVVVFSLGTDVSPATVAVFLGKGDGTLQAGATYATGFSVFFGVAFDFNGDNNLDLAVLNSYSQTVSILLGRGDGTFAAPVNYPVPQGAESLATGDFNGDGHADVVVGGSQLLSMLFGNGDGTFRAAVNVPVTVAAYSMAAGDFNKDGKLDLAIGDTVGGTVSIVLGNGQGGFASEYDYVAGYLPGEILATDLDGDGNLDVVIGSGHPDILAPNQYSDTVTAFFGRGDGTLIAAPVYPLDSNLGSMVLADFNGDGKPDVAAAARELWIMMSRGGGSFKTPVKVTVPSTGASVPAIAVAAGDFNGDGKQDLVVGATNKAGVSVLLGNGDGTFQAPVQYPVGDDVTSVVVGDFNGDGKLDIAFCGPGASYTSTVSSAGVLLGNGDGTFQSVKPLTGFGGAPLSLAVGDFNRDGKLDLAIANQGANDPTDPGAVLVYLGKGDGTFQNPVGYPAGVGPYFIAAADVNGDKAPDLIVATTQYNDTFDIGVLLGNGNGTFHATSLLATEYGQDTIAVADLNGDGKPDLAISHCCGQTDTTVMYGNGDGTFQPEVVVTNSSSSTTVLVTDLNGDGKPDLLIGLDATYLSYISVFLNTSAAPLVNVNAASFLSGPLAPNSFATALGAGLATAAQPAAALPLPTNLGGTTVTVTDSSGVQQLAPLAYVSPGQVNYVVPGGAALGPATVTVSVGGVAVASGSVVIAAIGPGIFLFGGTNIVAAYVTRVKADLSQTNENIYAVNSSGALVAAPINLGPPTDQVYLVLYGTGLRGHSSASNSVTVTAGGVGLPVSYAGAQPQFPGLDQIDALLPQSLAGKGDVTIQVTVDGQAANPGHVTIQ
jgi:uncharacterized protein (TIGR03437 family)